VIFVSLIIYITQRSQGAVGKESERQALVHPVVGQVSPEGVSHSGALVLRRKVLQDDDGYRGVDDFDDFGVVFTQLNQPRLILKQTRKCI